MPLTSEDILAIRDALMAVLGPRIDAVDRKIDLLGPRLDRLEERMTALELRMRGTVESFMRGRTSDAERIAALEARLLELERVVESLQRS